MSEIVTHFAESPAGLLRQLRIYSLNQLFSCRCVFYARNETHVAIKIFFSECKYRLVTLYCYTSECKNFLADCVIARIRQDVT